MAEINSTKRSQFAIKRAQNWLESAKRGLEDKRWNDCVYNAQMASEHAIKAIFLWKGIHYKRIHDISELVRRLQDDPDLPAFFSEKIPQYAENIEELTELRNLAGYGFEEGIDNDYFETYAPTAFKWAEEIVKNVIRILDESHSLSNNA